MTPVAGATILYMEDDADDLFLFREALKSFSTSCRLLEAKDGEEGLALLAQLKQSRSLPCLIVLDVNMPRMNGKEAFQCIQADEANSHIPIIVFSTSTNCTDKAFFSGPKVEYLSKPRSFSHFVAAVQRFLTFCRGDEPSPVNY